MINGIMNRVRNRYTRAKIDKDALVAARAEIIRLRAEVERLEADRATAVVQTESDYQHEIDTLRAEVERIGAPAGAGRAPRTATEGTAMSEYETLRDKFAAAALTGLVERRPWPVDEQESASICYEFADAMLRERAATNHDAAPEARAVADRERPDNPPARPGDGTGDTPTLAAGARAENREGGSGDRQPPHSSPASAVTNVRPAPTADTLTDAELVALKRLCDAAKDAIASPFVISGHDDSAAVALVRGFIARHER